ncbi:hypoxanthine phosphoribosyltransferase [Alphaproteobacteria bacterium]|nr:hypoxanthine phosphoribosyltransferase [Alphaproteobacteria bacterium]
MAQDVAAAMPPFIVMAVQLKGGFVFAADLLRALGRYGVKADVVFLPSSRLEDASSDESGLSEVKGHPALFVADVLDTGLHAANAVRLLTKAGAKSVKICTLLDKPARRVQKVEADFVGFTIPDRFVVGYGVDHAEDWRFLSYIAAVD